MLEKIKKLRVKKKFMLVICFLFLIGVIADIGLYEVAKTADFQRLERDHLKSMDRVEVQSLALANIKHPENSALRIREILYFESDEIHDMGIAQLVSRMKTIVDSFYSTVNPIEKSVFSLTGFKNIFHLAEQDYTAIDRINKALEDYKLSVLSFEELLTQLKIFVVTVRGLDDSFSKEVNSAAHFVKVTIISIVTIGLAFIILLAMTTYRIVMGPLDKARNNINTSSRELQVNSRQQLDAVSNQTTAITEINSVMQELVATSGQVAEISEKTASLSRETNKAVEEGQVSLDQAIEGIKRIKEKVEISTSNMLSLGEKSQHIGVVLDVINELSQQVTVLSYNATIEAAGAGEIGKRFMAVADRIIKLAERSVESAKEVKSIIDDIQSNSNKTIMSTEDGIKAVEDGITYSMEIKKSLDRVTIFTRDVLSSVEEINMSIAQQKTGVEQAASEIDAITVLVQQTKDGSGQVLQTADQLLDMAGVLENI